MNPRATIDYESGFSALQELFGWWNSGAKSLFRNEAQTRFDLIDRLLTSCIGWSRDDIRVERPSDGHYTDYELGLPAQVVVEAKREGVGFELPAGFDRPTYPLARLRAENDQIRDAIDQSLDYALRRGIPVAAVANGHQLIVFLASRVDGVPPLTGRALVFASLSDMRDRFLELWNSLSPPGVSSKRLVRLLEGDAAAPPPNKLSSRLVGYPGYKNRNPISAELQILGGMFFEDLLRRPEIEADFLRECYTPSGSLSQYALVSREILAARYSVFVEAEAEATLQPARSKAGLSPQLLADVFAAGLGQRPIILLGDVGVGKTMFTRHFIKVEASDILDRSFVLYVDFGSRPALADDLNSYVRTEFKRQLLDDYGQDIDERGFVRSVYRPELQRFSNGIFGALAESDLGGYRLRELEMLQGLVADEEAHLKRSLEHFTKAQKRQAVAFLDNVDQRPFAFQEQVFLIANALAANWPVACFIALRPETFYRSKREGALTGYQPRVFTIEPPRVDRVIRRRLQFARKEVDRTGRLPSFPANVTVTSERLSAYIDLLLDAFSNNEALISFVDNMSGGNVRRALEFVVAFVGSGHVDSMKIFDAIDRGGYTLPLHEFMRAVTYGEHEFFDPNDSPIANVFDVSRADGREHFLQGLIVGFVEMKGGGAGLQGYVPTVDVYGFAQSLGFEPLQIAHALDRMAAKYLLEISPRFVQEEVRGSDSERCRVTTVAMYTTKDLITQFQYLDAVSVDTPIVEPDVLDQLSTGRSIEERLERAQVFKTYLDGQWEPFRASKLPFDWDAASTKASTGFVAVAEGVRRNAGRSGRDRSQRRR
ncbi:MAG: hypothetical protein M3P85_04710 [Actinomycetota bacterium]|nr:hypothetical protein [Actinomycetota bacterium]